MKHKVLFWLVMINVYLVFFLAAYISLKLDVGLLHIMPPVKENFIIMAFCVLGLFKSIFEIYRT